MSLRLIVDVVLLLKRYSPLFFFVADNGDVVLDSRIVFLGGLGPTGDTAEVPPCNNPGLVVCFLTSIPSNSGPKENAGASHPAYLLSFVPSGDPGLYDVIDVSYEWMCHGSAKKSYSSCKLKTNHVVCKKCIKSCLRVGRDIVGDGVKG
jgi:hypothetical protein